MLKEYDEPVSDEEADVIFDIIHEDALQRIHGDLFRRNRMPREGTVQMRQALRA